MPRRLAGRPAALLVALLFTPSPLLAAEPDATPAAAPRIAALLAKWRDGRSGLAAYRATGRRLLVYDVAPETAPTRDEFLERFVAPLTATDRRPDTTVFAARLKTLLNDRDLTVLDRTIRFVQQGPNTRLEAFPADGELNRDHYVDIEADGARQELWFVSPRPPAVTDEGDLYQGAATFRDGPGNGTRLSTDRLLAAPGEVLLQAMTHRLSNGVEGFSLQDLLNGQVELTCDGLYGDGSTLAVTADGETGFVRDIKNRSGPGRVSETWFARPTGGAEGPPLPRAIVEAEWNVEDGRGRLRNCTVLLLDEAEAVKAAPPGSFRLSAAPGTVVYVYDRKDDLVRSRIETDPIRDLAEFGREALKTREAPGGP